MKKKLFFAAVAIVALASCSSDEMIGVTGPQDNSPSDESNAIVFASAFKGVTRADHVGADAASMLSNHFTVGGFKGNGTTRTTVFDNYIVNWAANTAATTESNTSDWEYVGITAAAPSGITGAQTIKYWDFSTSQYDFVAYSTGARSAVAGETAATSGTSVHVTAIDPTKLTTEAYKLTGLSRADLTACYIADMITAYKADAPATYGKEVTFKFRSLAAKVRIALYETVPGYSVKDVKFYAAHPSTLGTGSTTTATLIGTMNEAGTYTVSFPTIGSTNKSDPNYNKAHVAFASTSTSSSQGFGTIPDAQLKTKESREKIGTKFLGRTLPEASYAGTGTFYQEVLPNEGGEVFELAVDYTLESIDGSGEEINVYGATAYVPANYAKWLPNYAYTYIFKISDNSNGWTSTVDTDPKGLYPITFDAVVLETEDYTQKTITTVASPSITTYQKAHDLTKNEYAAANGDIYVQVMVGSTLKADLDTKGKLYTVKMGSSTASCTEASIMDALNIGTVSGSTITGRNGITLSDAATAANVNATVTTIPGPDGNNITVTTKTAAKFTPAASTIYAYVYDATPADPAPVSTYLYSAEVLSSSPSDWSTAGVWYKDPNGSEAVGDYADGTYYKKWENKNKVYGVKIIRVQ